MTKYLLGLCLLWLMPNVMAQTKFIKNMATITSEKIADETWRVAEKQKSDYDPAWEKESAIFLNYTNIYDITKESAYKTAVTQLIHRKVKVLDDSAIEYFSEISFPGESREVGYKRERTSSGVRVIKKNGKVENIQSENYIRNEDDNTKKLAVPNLEIGDVLEYFIYAKDVYSASLIGSQPLIYEYFTIQGEYPILHYKYLIQSQTGFTTWMLSSDKNIKVKTDSPHPRSMMFYVEKSDLNSTEGELWYDPYKSLPTIKVQVNGVKSGPTEGKTLYKNEIMDYTKNLFVITTFDKNIEKAYKKSLKKRGTENLTGSKALKDYYFFLRHLMEHREILSQEFNERDRNYSANYFYYAMIRKMEELDINYRYVVAKQGGNNKMNDVVHTSELNYLVRAEIDGGIYFSYLSPFMSYGHLPYGLEDADAYLVYTTEEYKKINKERIGEEIKLPKSKYKDNGMVHNSVVDFDLEDLTKVDVKTDVILTGHQYPAFVYPLVDWYDQIWQEIDDFETIALANSSDAKGALKMQRKKVIENRKKYMKEQLKSYAKNHYYKEIEDISNTKSALVEEDGKPTELQVHFDCKMEDLIKKVGPNYILKIGKLVGGQVSIPEEPRKYDVHMDYPRMFDYTVKVNLPKGYSVDGLEDINTSIDNASGMFKLSHELKGQELTLRFTKVYKNNFVKKSQWPQMVDFLKPANLFESKEILLRKQ